MTHQFNIPGGRTRAFRVRPLLIFGAIVLLSFVSFAQETKLGSIAERRPLEEPWEPDDVGRLEMAVHPISNPARIFSDCAVALIGVYQKSIGPNSIQRCPFFPSCSNFALTAIQTYGFFPGLCLFIDRNLYRENPGIIDHYGLIRLPSGILKLDDHFYLTGAE